MSWWGKTATAKRSEFFKGISILDRLVNSTFGRFKTIVASNFGEKEMDKYPLPKVVVIGNESSGKSSLLENITKCHIFPRSTGICTRCPIHLILKEGKPHYQVTWKGVVT